MDNRMDKHTVEKFEERLLCLFAAAGLLFMVLYWR